MRIEEERENKKEKKRLSMLNQKFIGHTRRQRMKGSSRLFEHHSRSPKNAGTTHVLICAKHALIIFLNDIYIY